jgi:hypothetical protein
MRAERLWGTRLGSEDEIDVNNHENHSESNVEALETVTVSGPASIAIAADIPSGREPELYFPDFDGDRAYGTQRERIFLPRAIAV